uniref:ABC transporter domain-containing protein n=1 Tax=Tetradesmus obliquus TaxID=3088 RepID=A0A383VUC2_TETOB|eukprot:jgi/Sobl393_1/9415/SZX69097.1
MHPSSDLDICTASNATASTATSARSSKDVEAADDTHLHSSGSSSTARKDRSCRSRLLPWSRRAAGVSAAAAAAAVGGSSDEFAQNIIHIGKVEWQGVCCSYMAQGANKVVLHDVWGVAMSNEVQALMGPSGAGKSTFDGYPGNEEEHRAAGRRCAD